MPARGLLGCSSQYNTARSPRVALWLSPAHTRPGRRPLLRPRPLRRATFEDGHRLPRSLQTRMPKVCFMWCAASRRAFGEEVPASPLLLWTCVGPALCSAEGRMRRSPTSLRLCSQKLHLPGQDAALRCPVVQWGAAGVAVRMHLGDTRLCVARHVHGARAFEEAAPVVFVSSRQRPPPVTGEGRAKRRKVLKVELP